MEIQIQTIYYLENPEEGVKKWVTESQLKYEDIIKDVFGVALVSDLPIMIQYNKKFQNCICNTYQIPPNQINLEMIFRIASKDDLLGYREQYLANKNLDDGFASPPFDPVIKLSDGIYQWNEKSSAYIKVDFN